MKGISYLVDANGKKNAVLISLDTWGELWEDMQDVMLSNKRLGEEKVKWSDIKKNKIVNK